MTRYFRIGQYIFKEGESSSSMFLIKSGSVSIRKMKGSAYIEIARAFQNEVIGELSFFDRQPRSASAMAITEVEALEIDFQALDKVYKKVPDYLQAIMSAVADRLRKADETIRRLQKNVVMEPGSGESAADDTASILEATSEIDVDSTSSNDDPI